jgi:hypothetical protein
VYRKYFKVRLYIHLQVNVLATIKIDEYEVMYSSNKFPPRIWLKSAGKYIGQLIFQPNGSTLSSNALVGTQYNMYYHLDDFQNCIDLLRNEKPMYLLWNGPTSENGIKTMAEIVGESDKT